MKLKRIILVTSLCLAGLSGAAMAGSQSSLMVAQSDTTAPAEQMTPAEQRDSRIQNNTAARTDNRVQRREDAAGALGAPGLDRGIQRRNDRRENRRDTLRTGEPAQPQAQPQ
jgi:hypothetical protein